MFPDKHFGDLESSRKRRKVLNHAGVSIVFLVSFLFLGQLVHELSHVIPLELTGCGYRVSPGFTVMGGLHAEVQPLCSPSNSFLALFYSLGYVSTLAGGWGVLVAAKNTVTGWKSNLLAASGTGMLLSILLTVGSRGDIHSFLSVLGLDTGLALLVSAGLALTVFAVSFSGVKMLLED